MRILFFLLFPALALAAGPARAANPDALWQIVSRQCVPGSIDKGDPAPCAMVDHERGFVLLKDIVGAAQYLLIPTRRLAGIESPELLSQQQDAPNYWRYAWEQHDRVGAALGRPLEPDQVGLEVNSAAARSQLQLHIHIDCMRADMPQRLRRHRRDPFYQWMPLMLAGHRNRVMRLSGDALQRHDPFKLAARDADVAGAMAAQSLLLTGARFDHGEEGFYLIDMPVNFDKGERGSAEVLLDHDCAIAG